MRRTRALRILALALLATPVCLAQDGAAEAAASNPRDSVVKIMVTYRAPDLYRPWAKQGPEEITGTGFVIEGNRIITNAHVAEHASRVLVQPPGETKKLVGEVVAIASGIDLAVITLQDEAEAAEFFAEHPPMTFKTDLPDSGSTVQVYGFPMGGTQLSITAGDVNRIEYDMYYNLTPGLTIQIDAAVNPGNSGGPAVQDGGVIGVVFSTMDEAENIAYLIPTEEVLAFLDDVEDGSYEGRPRLWVSYQKLVNQSLRDSVGVGDDITGVLYVSDEPSLEGGLHDGDIITAIGPWDVDNEGTIRLRDDIRVDLEYAAPHAVGPDGSVPLTVHRAGSTAEVRVPAPRAWPFVMPYMGADYPPYMIYGPLVFIPAYQDFFNRNNGYLLALRKSPLSERAFDVPRAPDEQFVVVLSPMFPHPIAQGYDPMDLPALERVNGVEIRSLAHLVEVLRDVEGEFVTFEWHGRGPEMLVFPRGQMDDVTEEILENNGIRRQMSPELQEIWDAE